MLIWVVATLYGSDPATFGKRSFEGQVLGGKISLTVPVH